ncbi:glycosyltransferase [Kushneria phosphatilytica]|uniref:Glycosyltransferase family 4 protein n=1 Tax=Kushneria phosphatilytica TaxID=657387 RepID=A0A1S1NZ52_9GAMM|nr:glycosyltransferase [Kushneria phosphatilytica]OHV13796.1 glycosyl transferase family 1 [Kushneria phosphatilytica]QEL10345.1 glycosyltransferase family 4 protein [Kushneria phosphatilytica]
MNILMFTNTYRPIVGGVSESVQRFVNAFEALGHRVLVVAPTLSGQPEREESVIRVPALQRFNGSDFSWPIMLPGILDEAIRSFEPDVVHANHPFLLGDTAARVARTHRLPLIFTHHTLYEHYTHYVPGDPAAMRRFAIAVATGFARMSDAVIAPSESIRDLLYERGLKRPVHVVPSGVDTERFHGGDRIGMRARLGLGEEACVIGHVGRLAQEKNLGFLSRGVCRALQEHGDYHFLVVGSGDEEEQIRELAIEYGVSERVHLTGVLRDGALVDAYSAMDCFAFASHSETQGMVVVEAMAAGLPVVALAAPGVSEVVEDGVNGVLLEKECEADFAAALLALNDPSRLAALRQGAWDTAARFDQWVCAERCLAVYRAAMADNSRRRGRRRLHRTPWQTARAHLNSEWKLFRHRGRVLKAVLDDFDDADDSLPPDSERDPLNREDPSAALPAGEPGAQGPL